MVPLEHPREKEFANDGWDWRCDGHAKLGDVGEKVSLALHVGRTASAVVRKTKHMALAAIRTDLVNIVQATLKQAARY